MWRENTGYPLHSPVSPSLPPLRHRVPPGSERALHHMISCFVAISPIATRMVLNVECIQHRPRCNSSRSKTYEISQQNTISYDVPQALLPSYEKSTVANLSMVILLSIFFHVINILNNSSCVFTSAQFFTRVFSCTTSHRHNDFPIICKQ